MSIRNLKFPSKVGAAVAAVSSVAFLFRERNVCSSEPSQANVELPSSKPGVKLLFLGTGSSTGCPKPLCSLLFPEKNHSHILRDHKIENIQNEMRNRCHTSILASKGDPRTNRNYRNNPSLVISHINEDDQLNDGASEAIENQKKPKKDLRNVIIDVGKTFRETAIRWMPLHGIYSVDGVVLTHEHADAMLGLDDLRGFQMSTPIVTKFGHVSKAANAIPIHLSGKCFDRVKEQFPYLVPKNIEETTNKENEEKVVRHVASLEFNVVTHFKPFIVSGLRMIPLPVIHGEDFICNGYAFSVKNNHEQEEKMTHVVYLSDLSRMPNDTLQFICNELPPTDILVIDSLSYSTPHQVHFSLDQAMNLAKIIGAKKTYIVGINCDDFPDHYEANRRIKARDPSVELAYDGLAIEL
jgi:phosphoribosyl 1,2-cyclic phosphodiesterase